MEHATAAAISEIEAFNPQSLEEARQRPDWPKWQIAIQEELKALETASTWKIVERPENRNIVKINGYSESKKTQLGKSNNTKQDLLLKVSHKYKALIIMICGHLLQNSD
jgi:hypothetical protein